MLEEIGCNAWVFAQDYSCPVKGMQSVIFPNLEDFLEQSSPTASYPYSKTWEQAKDEIIYIIHTSGTTGETKTYTKLQEHFDIRPSEMLTLAY